MQGPAGPVSALARCYLIVYRGGRYATQDNRPIICPFTRNGAFLCVNDVVVDLVCRKLTQINTFINTGLTSSYT